MILREFSTSPRILLHCNGSKEIEDVFFHDSSWDRHKGYRILFDIGRRVQRARLKSSKILPATQLFRQGAVRAIGCIAQAKIFVDLEQSLLSDQGTHEVVLPRIAGK